MAEIKHRVGIKGSAAEIYPLLTTDGGLAKWWTTDARGAGDVGSIIEFRFDGAGPDFEVVELVPERRVRWRHRGETPPAWRGTEVRFDLREDERQTIIDFSHGGWAEADDFFAHCCTKWGIFLMSMKSCIETGKGHPYPDDVHIDFDE